MAKKVFAIIVSFVMLAVIITGCSSPNNKPTESTKQATVEQKSGTQEQTASTEKKFKIGLSMPGMNAPYAIPVVDYAKAEAEKLGVELVVTDAEWTAQKQADQVASMVAQKMDAILLFPTDAKSLVPTVKMVKEANIPLVNLNSRLDDKVMDIVDSFVGYSMTEEAEMAAEMMIEALGDKGGKIVVIEGFPGSDPQIQRTKGFMDKIATAKNIQVIGTQSASWDRAKAMAVMEDFLIKNPEIDGVYCHDDNMAIGAIQAAKAAKRADKIKFVSISANIDGLEAVKNGELYGTVSQGPDWEGAQGVRTAVDILKGEKVKAWYRGKVEKVTKENVANFKGLW